MKSPAEIAHQQARLWANNEVRLRRLLEKSEWPLILPVAKPSPDAVARRGAEVRAHLDKWRAVEIGEVGWEPVTYRATGIPIDVPVRWILTTASEWIEAIGVPTIRAEFETLERLLAVADPRDHQLLVRRRSLVVRHGFDDIEAALRVADSVSPGCANGVPLRALALGGVDTKFYERSRTLLVALLDERFGGAASTQGLEAFLGAAGSDGHWLLVADLDGSLLPYRRTRVTDVELSHRGIPGTRLLVVENERCLHALPATTDTVAILGAGLNLGWLGSKKFADHEVAYWGDLDTWGLRMLAIARAQRPDLTPLLMDESTFETFRSLAVVEPEPSEQVDGLSEHEQALFDCLVGAERGRLEQEFLPADIVSQAVAVWLDSTTERSVGNPIV